MKAFFQTNCSKTLAKVRTLHKTSRSSISSLFRPQVDGRLLQLVLKANDLFQRYHNMAAQTSKLSNRIHFLMRSCLDVNPALGSSQQPHDILLHSRLKTRHLRPFQNQRNIYIANLIPIVFHHFVRVLHELGTVASLPSRIRVLEDLSDIRQRKRAEDCVDEAVVYHIPVRVGHDTKLGFVDIAGVLGVFPLRVRPLLIFVVDDHPSYHHRLARLGEWRHAVDVEPVSYPQRYRLDIVRGAEYGGDLRLGRLVDSARRQLRG
mmetsp:Transcript_17448/g.40670  ORF Transcript_17448/g.40670 Transcript_17448/m.40670 type:complete len:262 (-) Transcript_17448:200-985(-)